MLKIYYADISAFDDTRAYALSDYRMQRLSRTRQPSARKAGIGAELVLYSALHACASGLSLPPEIIIGEYGKPRLRGGEVQFSLSHSHDIVGAAVCDVSVGLDIQKRATYNAALARRFFTPEETAHIEACADKDRAFTRIWCEKESYIKALGTGLNTPLASFSVVGLPGLFSTEIGEYAFAVCVPGCEALQVDSIEKVELP